jgi:hypothetical protein
MANEEKKETDQPVADRTKNIEPVFLKYGERRASTEHLLAADDQYSFMTSKQRQLVELYHEKMRYTEILAKLGVKSTSSLASQCLLKYFRLIDKTVKPRFGRDKKYKLKSEFGKK